MSDISPVYLFADSQLLFWKQDGGLFLKSLLIQISSPEPRASYIGASNGNQNVFFELFQFAMEGIGIQNCKMIGLDFSSEDRLFLEKSDIILLAGGDVEKGWNIIQSTGLKESILNQYQKGAVIIGISAGAVQLGLLGDDTSTIDQNRTIDFFQIVPYIIDVNEEKEDWSYLKALLIAKGGSDRGIGIPLGGGAIYHPDNTIEPIRKNIYEVFIDNGISNYNLLCANYQNNSDTIIH